MHEPIMNVCLELKEPVQGRWGYDSNFLVLRLQISWKKIGMSLSNCYWFSFMKKQLGSLKLKKGNLTKIREIGKSTMRELNNI